jgi:hypothetical protein
MSAPTFNFVLLASVLRDSMVRPGSPEVSFPPELAILQRLGCEHIILLVILHGR